MLPSSSMEIVCNGGKPLPLPEALSEAALDLDIQPRFSEKAVRRFSNLCVRTGWAGAS
jgi:hypothetical protein